METQTYRIRTSTSDDGSIYASHYFGGHGPTLPEEYASIEDAALALLANIIPGKRGPACMVIEGDDGQEYGMAGWLSGDEPVGKRDVVRYADDGGMVVVVASV